MEDTAVGLLGRHERLWPTVLVSLAAHAAVVTLAVAFRPAPIIDLEQKPIVARLVRLGEKRPESFLPRKEEAPPPSAEAPVPVPGPPSAAPSPEAAKAAQKPVPTRPGGGPNARSDALANALNRIRRDKTLGQPVYGDPGGDPEGDSSEGSEGDRYLALVTRALQANYRLPSTLSEKERMFLKATVVLFIEPDGKVSRFRFEKRSGSVAFDDALDRAIRQTRLPPPPTELRERYRSVGLGVLFQM